MSVSANLANYKSKAVYHLQHVIKLRQIELTAFIDVDRKARKKEKNIEPHAKFIHALNIRLHALNFTFFLLVYMSSKPT